MVEMFTQGSWAFPCLPSLGAGSLLLNLPAHPWKMSQKRPQAVSLRNWRNGISIY